MVVVQKCRRMRLQSCAFFPWRPAGGRSSTSAANVDDVEIVADVDYLEGLLESRPLRDL